FLKDAQKQGKQIWYFTAPESVPIEVVQEHVIPLDRAEKGQPILTHNGDDYGVGFDTSTSTSIKVVIPSKDGADYELLQRPIDQTIHLKRMTRFERDGEASVAVTKSHTAAVTARAQPHGLKARFLPIGVTASTDRDGDTAMMSAPVATPQAKGEKKRKLAATRDETSSQQDKTTSSTKAKKARFSEPGQPPAKITPILPPSVPGPSV
ncbi:hypothetical protein GQ53DRAFT_602061, partial [Thozetella sp. PMI_491]